MIPRTSDGKIFVRYKQRSMSKFWPDISKSAFDSFGAGPFQNDEELRNIYFHVFEACKKLFVEIIQQRQDLNFVKCLNVNHEDSFDLYKRTLAGENLEQTEGIHEADLAMNRRILKLALEQCCDIYYSEAIALNDEVIDGYIKTIEDLLYVGSQLYSIAECIAELKMVPNMHEVSFDDDLLQFKRKGPMDALFQVCTASMRDNFAKAIFDEEFTNELRSQLKACMGIDYDFAGEQIFKIQEHHSPKYPMWQTIDPNVLPLNLIRNFNVAEKTANDFYAGLSIDSTSKLDIGNAIYKPHAPERFLYRPILLIQTKDGQRALVGKNKWVESIVTMGANGFQWQHAPKEWMQNDCFKAFIMAKSDEHDKYLEDKVQESLTILDVPFDRNLKTFYNSQGQGVRIEIKGVGEIDFILLDHSSKKIIVADCKYNRSRYDMVGFSNDFSNFEKLYEPKIDGKIKWITDNLSTVEQHFKRKYPKLEVDLQLFAIEGLFIINTPTFYSLNGRIKTISWFELEDYLKRGCVMPTYSIQWDGKTVEFQHPYFK